MIRVDSAEAMVRAVRGFGIIPFFKCGIPGWSIEDMTPPECWFFSSDELGPWDWKVDVVREGDIAYGKFLGGKAAFATVEYYKHLMNWRRSIPKYRMALGEKFAARTNSEKLMKALSPAALDAIRSNGSADAKEVRLAASAAVTPALLRALGAGYRSKLMPSVKKGINDSIVQFLEMGTWTVVGDITRVYRGPNLEYSGWQRSSFTTPDDLFRAGEATSEMPFWARLMEESPSSGLKVECSPEESRQILIDHVLDLFPGEEKALLKLI